jgi:EmrB/QacA subfamily drug resistance transporter
MRFPGRDGVARASAPIEVGTSEPPVRSPAVLFVVVTAALLMASIDQTIVATALPTIQHDLRAPLTWSSWTITIYSLGQLISMPLCGRLSDQFGRRTVFLSAVLVFTISSLACSLAPNVELLVVFRALQALGGGAFIPSATGIVADAFGDNRDRAIGLFSSVQPFGAVAGPILGGVAVTYWDWRAIFWVNVPIGLVILLAAWKLVPRLRPESVTRRPDGVGALLLAVSILACMFGLAHLGQSAITSPWFWGSELLGFGVGALMVARASRMDDPFLPVQLLSGRGFGIINVINLFFGAAIFGFAALVPLYAQSRYDIAPLGAGTLLTARAVGTICIAATAALLIRRTGYRAPIMVGLSLMAIGMLALAWPSPLASPATWLAIAAGVTGLGMGTCVPAANNASLQLLPGRVSAVAGLRGMFRQCGGIIAISIVTARVANANDPGTALAQSFVAIACLLLVVVPFVRLVPEHRGGW